MGKRLAIFGLGCLAAAMTVAVVYAKPEWSVHTRRLIHWGGPLMELYLPVGDQQFSDGAIEVLVSFPFEDRAAVHTFRCLLNDEDVTRRLTRAANGAAGSLVIPRDGENRLRIEIFGPSRLTRQWLEDHLEVSFRIRPLPSLDRAERLTAPGPGLG